MVDLGVFDYPSVELRSSKKKQEKRRKSEQERSSRYVPQALFGVNQFKRSEPDFIVLGIQRNADYVEVPLHQNILFRKNPWCPIP